MIMKNNSSTLTNITMLVLVQLLLVGTMNGFAQDEKFGDDPDKCKENISLYREYYKQKNYQDALPGWRWSFFNCPLATKNIVINGPTIIEHFIKKNEANPEVKKAYLDTLWMVYDKRIELYPDDKGYALGRKGMDQYDYSDEDYTDAYQTLEQSMKVDKLETDAYVLMRLYLSGMKRLIAQQIEMDVMYDLYDEVSTIIDAQFKKFEPGTTDENSDFKKLSQAREVIDQNFERIAKEEQYVELMAPKVKAAPSDGALLEKVVTMMTKRKWTGNDLYLESSELLYKLKPSATAAYGLYEGCSRKGKDDEATKYLEEAVKLEQDKTEKADKMLKLAKVYGSQKSYSKARSTAQEAAALRPGWGEPFLYIGDLYLGTTSSCGDNACNQKYAIWAAEDMFIKAKSVDPGVSDEANKKIASCKNYYPSTKDCFFYGLKAGDKVTVGPWIGVETTARFAD
jgi:tetratricopeptide (TPR) repeat protein